MTTSEGTKAMHTPGPNVRLYSRSQRRVDSSWTVRPEDSGKIAWSWKLLQEYRDSEPHSDWILETRGELTEWHRWEDPRS